MNVAAYIMHLISSPRFNVLDLFAVLISYIISDKFTGLSSMLVFIGTFIALTVISALIKNKHYDLATDIQRLTAKYYKRKSAKQK